MNGTLVPSKYQEGIVDALQNLAIEGLWNDSGDSRLVIVVHIRQADGMRHPIPVYVSAVTGLKSVAPDAHIIVHSDGHIAQSSFPAGVEFKDRRTNITDVVKDFIRADVLVISQSSFSNAAGLFRLGRPVLAWTDKNRLGMMNLPGWHVLGKGEKETDLNYYIAIVAEALAWKHKAAGKMSSQINPPVGESATEKNSSELLPITWSAPPKITENIECGSSLSKVPLYVIDDLCSLGRMQMSFVHLFHWLLTTSSSGRIGYTLYKLPCKELQPIRDLYYDPMLLDIIVSRHWDFVLFNFRLLFLYQSEYHLTTPDKR